MSPSEVRDEARRRVAERAAMVDPDRGWFPPQRWQDYTAFERLRLTLALGPGPWTPR